MAATGKNSFKSANPALVKSAMGIDTTGHIRAVYDENMDVSQNPLFSVDANGVPIQYYDPANPYFLGFDVYRDLELIADPQGDVIGFFGLDKYAAVHPFTITGPSFNYAETLASFNAALPEQNRVFLPFFGAFIDGKFVGLDLDVLGITLFTGADNGIARDIEVAVDWRSATNAFQGYYILDAFGGIHYLNNPEVLALFQKDGLREPTNVRLADSAGNPVITEPLGYEKFFEIFNFRARYVVDYTGISPTDDDLERALPPYFPGFPIARDLEVMVRWQQMTEPGATTDLVQQSQASEAVAQGLGVDTSTLFTPIAINPNRNNISYAEFTPQVAVTSGYAILDGFGGVHTLLEDQQGNPIPAPWENVLTGAMDPSVDAPYFSNADIAVDVEIMPKNGGFCILTRTGQVFVVNNTGTTAADNFVQPGIENDLPLFGFDLARDLTLVPNEEGKIVGMYVLDRFGTIHTAGKVPALPNQLLYFRTGNSLDLEVNPITYPITDAFQFAE
jgi:hypothetical protein